VELPLSGDPHMPTYLSVGTELIELALQVSSECTREALVTKALQELIAR
jgi:hypothetical protein